jgi:hypothetical protein
MLKAIEAESNKASMQFQVLSFRFQVSRLNGCWTNTILLPLVRSHASEEKLET